MNVEVLEVGLVSVIVSVKENAVRALGSCAPTAVYVMANEPVPEAVEVAVGEKVSAPLYVKL